MSHAHTMPELVAGDGSCADATDWIRNADRILIGAGAGLSAAAGYDYGDTARFRELFPALAGAGFTARYELIGYPLPPRHMWGYWPVHVNDIRLGTEPSPLYQELRTMVGHREHFVMSSNVDALFTRSGFESDRVYTPQGDYALYQCLTPCIRQVWDARPIIDRALQDYDPTTGQTSEAAIPVCPNCGGDVFLNVYAGAWYINDHFQPQLDGLNAWLRDGIEEEQTTVIVEIGAGFNTPGVIRWPMERIASRLPAARLVRINRDHPGVPAPLAARAASLDGDAANLIHQIVTTDRKPS